MSSGIRPQLVLAIRLSLAQDRVVTDEEYKAKRRADGRKRTAKYRAAHREELLARRRITRPLHREQERAYGRAHRAANLEQMRARGRAYHAANRSKVRAKDKLSRAKNKDQRRATSQKWVDANRDWVNERARNWRAAHPGYQTPYIVRQKTRQQAIPAWANQQAMKAFYQEAVRLTRETGIRHEVDHIYPLRGKTVSGLHCEANLRVVPGSVNRRKSNKYPTHATNPTACAF
jgi:hypothetical protein